MGSDKSRNPLRRFLATFAFCCLLGFALLFIPTVGNLVWQVSTGLVRICGSLIHICGGHALVDGAVLRSPANGFGIEMKNGCNAINVMILLCSAVLAFPAPAWQKIKGLLIGATAIQAINLVRFISLYYLGQYSRTWFDFVHNYVWESLIMLDAMVVFGLWINGLRGQNGGG